ncbi:MAG TPA: glycosyltransferase [Flavobacteriaceae bacterium]|nr:glycosyltransferase [Flavobacteriaceae bacterium]MAY53917.1 glycosyltransferase [Flavobacteriaceae bacterium]HBR55447.1 glycosyltransferase [Flavobacteriaceae bacterium]
MHSTKLLLITSEFPPQPGGIGNHAHHVAQSLGAHRFLVTVLADQRSESGEDEAQFDANQEYTVKRVKRRTFLLFTYLKRMYLSIQLTKKQDVILVSGKFSLWIAGLVRFFTSKKIVAVIHGSEVAIPPSLKQSFTKWCLRRCDTVIAISKFTASLVSNWNLKDIIIVPNGFSIPKSKPREPDFTEPLQLITVGNVTQRKGQHNIVQALPALLARFPKLQYHIVGIPTEKEKIQELALQLGVRDNVIFHGKVSEEEKINMLKQANVFVMLSETTPEGDVEGFGIAILEANALGLPAIGALGCGIEDAILDKNSGVLIDPKSPEQMVAAVTEILDNYHHYGQAAKKWSQRFTWDKISKQYAKILMP